MRDGTRVASLPDVGPYSRLFQLPLLLAFVAALSLGPQDADAGRYAPARSKVAARSKAAVQKRAASGRLKASTKAPSLRSKHRLRVKSKRGASLSRRLPKAKRLVATKAKPQVATKAKPRLGKTTKGISAARTKAIGKTKRAQAQAPTKLKRFTAAMGQRFARIKALPPIRGMGRIITKYSAATTRGLDRLQARAPPWLAKTMNTLRTHSVVSLAAFNLGYVKRDAKFLGTFFAASAVISYAVLPGAIALGLQPAVSFVLNALTTPLAVAVIVMRDAQQRRKAGQPSSVAQSARSIFSDYKQFASQRRADRSARAAALSPGS